MPRSGNTPGRIPMPSFITFGPPEQPDRTTYHAKVQDMAYSPLGEQLVFQACMPDKDDGDVALNLQWGNAPGEKAHWVLALVTDKSDVRPENASKAVHPLLNVLNTIHLVADGVERNVWLFPEVRKLMVFVHLPDEYVLEINLADKTKDEVKATGQFFRDITGVFKTLSTDEVYYVNIIRHQVYPPRGTLGVPNVTTRSWTRDVTQIQNCVHRMKANEVKAARATEDAGMSFTGHLATDHFKALVNNYRNGPSDNDETGESDSEAINPSRPRGRRGKQARSTKGKAKAMGKSIEDKGKFAEEAVDEWESGTEELKGLDL